MVDISPTAIEEIKRIQLNRQIPDSPLRLIVKSGGCFGLYYDFEFDDRTSSDGSSVVKSDATPHQIKTLEHTHSRTSSHQESDRLIELNGINLVVNTQSWKYVEHLELDYSEDLMGGGFRFHNPQIEKTCGCGISFSEPIET